MSYVIAALALQSDGLTLRDYLADIPRDPAAIFMYLLLLTAVGLIVLGSRRRGPGDRDVQR